MILFTFVPLCLCVEFFSCSLFHHLAASEPACVIFYVDAPKLCYDSFETLVQGLAKSQTHKDGRLYANVGHAWLKVCGTLDGHTIDVTLGHSGELGVINRPYFEGVMDLLDKKHPNPVSYLFSSLSDGFAQFSSGGHLPTFAAKCLITQQQLRAIVRFIHPKRYPYSEYALTGNQCASLVAQAAALAGLSLEHRVSVPIPKILYFGGRKMRLWTHPRYRTLTFSSPDKLEQSLKQLVRSGQAEEVKNSMQDALFSL